MTRRARQHGFALLLVLVLVLVAGTLGASYLSSASIKLASSVNMDSATRARYLAESGLEHAMYLLRSNPGVLVNSVAAPLGPYKIDGSDNTYILWVVADVEPGSYMLWAQATVDGITQTVSLPFESYGYYRELVMSYEPKYYWRLGESAGGVALEETGTAAGVYRNGVALGQPGGIVDPDDTAALFDGDDDYVDLGGLDVSGNQMTILAWVRQSASVPGDKEGRIVAKSTKDGRGGTHYWMLSTRERRGDPSRYLRFRLRLDGRNQDLKSDTNPLVAGQWYFCAAVYDGSVMRLYINGVEIDTKDKVGVIDTDPSVDAWIGANPPADNLKRAWSGDIDEVAIFETALTPAQLQALYEAGTAGN